MRRLFPLGLAFALLATPALRAQAPPRGAAPAVKPTDPDDLVVGPLDAELTWTVSEPKLPPSNLSGRVQLQILTKSQVAFRRYIQGKLQDEVWVGTNAKGVLPASRNVQVHSVKVSLPGGESKWEWDQKKKEFDGSKAIPAPHPQLKASAVPDEKIPKYLALAAEQVHLQLNLALRRRDEDGVKGVLRRAAELKAVAEKYPQARRLADLFELADYAKRQAKLRGGVAKCEDDLRAIELDATTVRKRIQAVADQERAGVGATSVGLGLAASQRGEEEEFLRAVLLIQDKHYDLMRLVAEQEAADVQLSKLREGVLTAEQREKITSLEKDYTAGKQALAGQLEGGWREVGFDAKKYRRLGELAADVYAAKDRAAGVRELAEREEALKAAGLVEPVSFAAFLSVSADVLLTPASTATQQRENADAVYRLAVTATDAVARIPADAAFGPDRAVILVAAADLIHRAIAYEVSPWGKGAGPKCWSAAFDPRAEYGVRLCDLAVEHDPADRNAVARGTRVWLLFQRGLFARAYDSGMKDVGGVRAFDPYTQVHLARVSAFTSPEKTASEATPMLARGMAVGFRDLRLIDSDPDFAWAKASKVADLDWRQYGQPSLNVVARMESDGGSLSTYAFEIRNTGSLPLVDARFTLKNGKNNAAEPHQVPYLAPGQVTRWYPKECKVTSVDRLELHVNNDHKMVGVRVSTVVKNIKIDEEKFLKYSYGGR